MQDKKRKRSGNGGRRVKHFRNEERFKRIPAVGIKLIKLSNYTAN